MPTMKNTHHETVVRKLIVFGAGSTLLLGLPFAFAQRAFASQTPKFAYVANLCDSSSRCSAGNVSAYTINSSTGALNQVAGSPFAAGIQPVSVAVDPSGRFAYVANECDSCSRGRISAYTINSSTGALRAVAGSPFAAGELPISVTVDPLGRFVYVANFLGGVSAYTINGSTGALRAVAGAPFAAGLQPWSVTVDPSGRFAYVTNSGDSTVSAYTINGSTGALSVVAGSPFAAGNFPFSVAVDPSGQFAYVANEGDDNVSAYAINSSTGALRPVAGSPFASGQFPYSLAVDPSGRFAYVANAVDNTVSAYAINSSTGALRAAAGSPFATGNSPQSVTVDPSGRFAYVVNVDGDNVSAYTIDSSTGALRAVSGSPFAAGSFPQSVAIAGQTHTTSVLTLTPRSLAFGNVPVNTSSATQSVTVTNTNPKAVAITSIALRGTAPGQFNFTDDCGKSLAGQAICTLEAQFTPSLQGAKTAFLDVNGGGGGRSVMLSGTGTSTNPWLGSWDGKVKSTCGYISGPFDIAIVSLGKNKLGLTDNYGDQYDLTISSNNPNVATSPGDVVRYTISGNSMKGREPNSCQTAWLTRVQ
jgi:6-phosphogluconolactonase